MDVWGSELGTGLGGYGGWMVGWLLGWLLSCLLYRRVGARQALGKCLALVSVCDQVATGSDTISRSNLSPS
jgi:hypothetical protein